MSIFKKEPKLDDLWKAYWREKAILFASEQALEKIKEEIIRHTRFEEGSKTAYHEQNKLQKTVKVSLQKPKKLDYQAFAREFPNLITTQINEKEVIEWLNDGDKRFQIEPFGFDLKPAIYYTFSKT
ncbi:MAG: hypothetical protein SFU27_06425 [Thermonemataceae bacterium]|nr:hypothetical protein [Thermonemataceae bacterium]